MSAQERLYAFDVIASFISRLGREREDGGPLFRILDFDGTIFNRTARRPGYEVVLSRKDGYSMTLFLDDVKIWNVTRSRDDLEAVYAEIVRQVVAEWPPPELAAWWIDIWSERRGVFG